MRLVFVGPPGSGKGTQARLLQERFGVSCIGTGDLLRSAVRDGTPSGKLAEPYMLRGELVPDDVVNARVAEFFSGANPPNKFLLDGYPRNSSQAEFLDASLAKCGLDLTNVIFFNVPDGELVQRLEARSTKENRPDDTNEVIKQRLKLYHQTTAPVVEHYRKAGLLAEVPATGDVEEIHRKVVAIIS
jgi:adenylate kinase